MNYYNDNDSFSVKWLKALIKNGLIPDGDVDDRSILDVEPKELEKYTQCHFFAGIGGWSRALELAAWPSDRPVWTGSCPCGPLSVAGKGAGEEDERHLWPAFYNLIRECRPATIFGEQVASKLGREWLAGVHADLEVLEYRFGAADLCAASVGAPHIRQRLWWVGDASSQGLPKRKRNGRIQQKEMGPLQGQSPFSSNGWSNSTLIPCADGKFRRVPGRVGNTTGTRCQTRGDIGKREEQRSSQPENTGAYDNEQHQPEIEPRIQLMVNELRSRMGDSWNDGILEALGAFPLSGNVPGRVGLLKGAGNAIVPQVAAEFIKTFTQTQTKEA